MEKEIIKYLKSKGYSIDDKTSKTDYLKVYKDGRYILIKIKDEKSNTETETEFLKFDLTLVKKSGGITIIVTDVEDVAKILH